MLDAFVGYERRYHSCPIHSNTFGIFLLNYAVWCGFQQHNNCFFTESHNDLNENQKLIQS